MDYNIVAGSPVSLLNAVRHYHFFPKEDIVEVSNHGNSFNAVTNQHYFKLKDDATTPVPDGEIRYIPEGTTLMLCPVIHRFSVSDADLNTFHCYILLNILVLPLVTSARLSVKFGLFTRPGVVKWVAGEAQECLINDHVGLWILWKLVLKIPKAI